MQLPHILEKSHQFIEDHEPKIWRIAHYVTLILAGIILLLMCLMAYLSFLA